MKRWQFCTIFAVVAVISLLSGAGAWANDVYVRTGVGLDWSKDTRFKDKDCTNHSPPAIYALYGCGPGNDGAPLSTHGDFSAPAGFELGLGHAVMPALRIEALFQYRPRFTLTGHANFLQTTGRQEVSARVSSLSGMFAAYVDLPQLGLPRLGPFSPFVGGGAGASYIDVGKTRMKFTRTRTIVPGGHQVNFAWMLTAGVGTSLTDRLTLDLAYRYTDSGLRPTRESRESSIGPEMSDEGQSRESSIGPEMSWFRSMWVLRLLHALRQRSLLHGSRFLL